MEAVIFFALFGIAVIVTLIVAVTPPTKKERSRDARRYADWLKVKYPGLDPRQAAHYRYRDLLGGDYFSSKKTEEEKRLAQLVMEGWHTWNGALK